MKTISKKAEELLEKPYQVIDILPERVPEEAPGRYFAVERYYLVPARFTDIRKRFADIVIKLYCYYDLTVLLGDADEPLADPEPEQLADWIGSAKLHMCILIGEDSLLMISTDDLHMTVFNADDSLMRRLELLAKANGLFVR